MTATSAPRPCVLVVDDEPAICKALVIALTRDGFDVVAAHGGEEAHAVLGRRAVDVLVVDLRMPDLRGDVVFHLATSLQPALAGRTVFTSGDHSPKAEALVAECGCPLVRKPFELHEIIAAVRALAPALVQSA
jgi:DNA-binding response OmpR family regulator